MSKKYNEIWDKIKSLFNCNSVEKEFNSKPVYINKYINTKIKIYNDIMYTKFKYKNIKR